MTGSVSLQLGGIAAIYLLWFVSWLGARARDLGARILQLGPEPGGDRRGRYGFQCIPTSH